MPEDAKSFSTSVAIEESRPEKTKSTSVNSEARHSLTSISDTFSGRMTGSIKLAASLYFLPAERSEAPNAVTLNQGWLSYIRINFLTTEPIVSKNSSLYGDFNH